MSHVLCTLNTGNYHLWKREAMILFIPPNYCNCGYDHTDQVNRASGWTKKVGRAAAEEDPLVAEKFVDAVPVIMV